MTDKWYVSKNKRSAAVVASIDDDRGKRVILAEKSINVEFGVNDELLSHELRDGDNSLEQILWKLGIVQSQDSKMKSRLHKDFFGGSILWLTPAVIEQTRHLTAFPGICRLIVTLLLSFLV
ncbi:hypothetical protein CsSME_00012314 [Camellia sinensis var. sinensis]